MSPKPLLTAAAILALAACASSPDAISRIAEFNGSLLKVTWSPTSDKKASVSPNDRTRDVLPTGEMLNSSAFASFFASVTGCRVKDGEAVEEVWSSGRPLILTVPKVC